jgi:hypothetical protein
VASSDVAEPRRDWGSGERVRALPLLATRTNRRPEVLDGEHAGEVITLTHSCDMVASGLFDEYGKPSWRMDP